MNIKNIFLFTAISLCFSCGNQAGESQVKNADSSKTVKSEPYNSDTVTTANASRVNTFSNDMSGGESVVSYFFASRIRGDEKWKDVCLPEAEWSNRFKEELEFQNKMKIVGYKYDHKACMDLCNVTMMLEYSKDGKASEKMEYLAFVERINDKWIITGFTINVHG